MLTGWTRPLRRPHAPGGRQSSEVAVVKSAHASAVAIGVTRGGESKAEHQRNFAFNADISRLGSREGQLRAPHLKAALELAEANVLGESKPIAAA